MEDPKTEENNQNENEDKPFYKKWWFWAIIILFLISISAGNNGDVENIEEGVEANKGSNQINELNEDGKVSQGSESSTLSQEDIEVVSSRLEEELEFESELVDGEIRLGSLDYNKNDNELEYYIDFQTIPESFEWTEKFVEQFTQMTNYIRGVEDKEFNMNVFGVTYINEGGSDLIPYVSVRYDYESDTYTTVEWDGKKLLD